MYITLRGVVREEGDDVHYANYVLLFYLYIGTSK